MRYEHASPKQLRMTHASTTQYIASGNAWRASMKNDACAPPAELPEGEYNVEVLLDGELAFSKLERGHMPSADDIVAGLEKLGLAKAA